MSILELIKTRRSIRIYKSKSVKDSYINRIIEAGIWTPSSGNTLPFKFLILDDREKIKNFFEILLDSVVEWKKESAQKKGISENELYNNYAKYLDGIQRAPVFIFLFFDIEVGANAFTEGDVQKFINNNYLYNSLRDSLFLCVGNMLLETAANELSSLYFELPRVAKTPVNSFFKLRETLEFFICLPIGYPDEHPEGKKRNINEFIIN